MRYPERCPKCGAGCYAALEPACEIEGPADEAAACEVADGLASLVARGLLVRCPKGRALHAMFPEGSHFPRAS